MADLRVLVQRMPHGVGLPLPEYQTALAAGLDLLAAIPDREQLTLRPREKISVPTGIAVALPPGYEAQVRPRSGLAARHGVTLLNSPGTVDADYRGEIRAILVNLGAEDFTIERGMRIAQLVIAPVTRIRWDETKELPSSERGEGGFGSTGTGT